MRAIKHEPSPASGAAGIGAAPPLKDPGATERQGQPIHVYGSNCWNEGEIPFPAANLSGIPSSAPALSRGGSKSFSLGRCGKGERGCPAPGSGKVGREASPPACWKIREILFCFGMNPRGFDILGGICWPCKNFSPPLSLSLSPRISKPQHWDKSKKGFLDGHSEVEWMQNTRAQARGFPAVLGTAGTGKCWWRKSARAA